MKKTGLLMALAVVVSFAFSASAQNTNWKKARTLQGVAYDSGSSVCGWIEIKCGKASKKNTAKVSGKLNLLGSKAITLSAKTVSVASEPVSVVFAVKGSTPLTISISGDAFSGSQSESETSDPISVESGGFGGGLSNTVDPTVTVDYDSDGVKLPDGWDILEEAVPDEVPFTINGKGKWTFGKASKPKYKKYREDGMTWYELTGLDTDDDDDDSSSKKKNKGTNISAMKLTYNAKNGTFKGSFKIYATNEFSVDDGKKPKLKAYSAKVTGMVVNGYGFGTATSTKLGLTMGVVVE